MAREDRLDFWRGLCLIDMLLVHLIYQNVNFGNFLGKLFGEYTRFAAGGFIFVSGMSIGVIFLPRVKDDKRRAGTYKTLWRRAIYILGIHYFATLVLLLMGILCPQLDDSGTLTQVMNPFPLLRNVFLLREGGDLLPFYVIMIALSPFVLELIRRKSGWICVLAASFAAFTYGIWHPWALAPAGHQMFPPILWQGIFILGLISGSIWPMYGALSLRCKGLLAGIAWVIAGCLFVMEYGWQWGMPQLSLGWWFNKVPLSLPEALRYLSIIIALIVTTDILWPLLGHTSAAAFVQTLGKKSLPVYVLHLWVVKAMGGLAIVWSSMGAWQALFAVAAVLILWLFALILDLSSKPKTGRKSFSFSQPAMLGQRSLGAATN